MATRCLSGPIGPQHPFLKLLTSRRCAFAHLMELAFSGGISAEVLCDQLDALIAEGWLVVWETETGPRVTLTPWAAERLGLVLVETGLDELPHWAPECEPEPAARLPFPQSWEARDRHHSGHWIDRLAGVPVE